MELVDIENVASEIHKVNENVVVVVDNTLLTPIFQRPLELGADIVIYSATKHFGGHADITMGTVALNRKDLFLRVQENQIRTGYFFSQLYNGKNLQLVEFVFLILGMGGIPSAFDCYLLLRSLKTLPLRMAQHSRTGIVVAKFLEQHPSVYRVCYPGMKV
jgi:cystathionine gamma-lyase